MLTVKQIEAIKTKICHVLDIKREPLQSTNLDIDEDYERGRSEQEVTKVVYNAFREEIQDIEGLSIVKRKYGNNMALPELKKEELVYQLYNHSAEPYATKEVTKRVEQLGKKFHILEFTISNDTYELIKLESVSFSGVNKNGRAKIDKRKVLWPAA